MKILDPVEKDKIPGRVSPKERDSKHDALYERVLQLNGLALPVQFGSAGEARSFRTIVTGVHSKGHRLGLAAILRGNTVFVYCKDSA